MKLLRTAPTLVVLILSFFTFGFLLQTVSIKGQGVTNDIITENAKPGTQGWQKTSLETATTTSTALMGYAGETSVNKGQSISLHVSSTSPTFTIDVYRVGYYGGVGARLITSIPSVAGSVQPTPTPDPTTGLIEANWPVSHTLQTGSDWVSGAYFARLSDSANNVNYIQFVVRDDAKSADILYQLPITTEQAYNNWGGKSLYDYNSTGGVRAAKVSFNRPYDRNSGSGDLFTTQYGFIRFLESKGYNIAYATNVDTHRFPNLMSNKKIFFSNYHDEYWSKEMRDNVTAARNAGKSLAFFDANNIYYQIRFEPSTTGSSNRTMVGYKDASRDPLSATQPSLTTVRWRDNPVNKPENELLGIMFEAMVPYESPYALVASNASHWVYEGTGMQNGDTIPGVVGYEYDTVFNNGFTPSNLEVLANTPVFNHEGNNSTAKMTIYQHPSGGYVFAAGTMFWFRKLDNNDFSWHGPDARLQRITTNILDKMRGVTPVVSPTPTPSPSPVVTPSPSPVVSPTPSPSPTGYPRQLTSSNPLIRFIETKAPVGNKIFIKAEVDPSVSVYQVDWYINRGWTAQDTTNPYFLGGDINGNPNGFTLSATSAELRAVAYYNGWNFVDAYAQYTKASGPQPSPSPSPSVSPSPSPSPSLQPSPSPSPSVQPSPSPAGYPRQLSSTNPKVKIIETKPREGSKVFIKVEVDPSITAYQVDWYINRGWSAYDNTAPYFLGGDTNGVPNGYTLPRNPSEIRPVVYYSGWNFVDAFTNYAW